MRAASINYRDVLMVEGSYNPKQSLPLIPCSDGAGEVAAVGEGVTRFAVGDRVTTLFSQGWYSGEPRRDLRHTTLGGPLDGTLSEYMVLSEEGVMPSPENFSDEEAATLAIPCSYWAPVVCRCLRSSLRECSEPESLSPPAATTSSSGPRVWGPRPGSTIEGPPSVRQQ